VNLKLTSLALLILAAGFCYYCPAQTKPGSSASPEERRAQELEESEVRVVQMFVERARTFSDLASKTDTLINLASLLWQHKGQENYARDIAVNLHNELRRTLTSLSPTTSLNERKLNLRLQQRVARFVARHDPKLAQAWLDELISEDAKDVRARHQLDVALDLASDGGTSEARRLAGEAVQNDFASLDIGLLLNFLHRLRVNDAAAADSLFIQTLGKLALQPRITAEDVLLIGNYLFINDADVGPDFVRFTPVRIADLYFPVGINGERKGLSRQLVAPYLAASLAILNNQLRDNDVQFPKRYEAVARMLSLKAQQFAPDLVGSFIALAREFSVSGVKEIFRPDKPSDAKAVDYESVKPSLEKLQGVARDERILGLAGTAYLQGDLDTASKLSELLSDDSPRSRLTELIAFRRTILYLEKGDTAGAEQALSKVSTEELIVILQLGLANQDVKHGRFAAALPRLQGLVSRILGHEIPARALYLLSASALLGAMDANVGIQVLGEAVKSFDNSSMTAIELSRREHLTTIQIGKAKVSFSVTSKAVPFGSLEEPLVSLYRKSPQESMNVLMGMKTEKVLGKVLLVLAKEMLEKGAPSNANP
jgi:hypothetical protein